MNANRRLFLYSTALAGLLLLLASALVLVRQYASDLLGKPSAATVPAGLTLPLLVVALIGLIAWVVPWGIANHAARPLTMAGAVERASPARKAYLYAGQFAALAAIVIQAGLALRALFLPMLDGATAELKAWLAAPVSLAAACIVALVFWGYLRWETVRDGDFGHEPDRGANWRRAYVYLAALVGSFLAIAGAGELLRTLLTVLNGGTGIASWQGRVANSLAALIVGAPLALLTWGRADRQAVNAPAAEVHALSRVALRYGGLFAGTVVTLFSLGYLLDQLFLFILRRPFGPYWTPAVAYSPVALITWLSCAGGVRQDVALAGEGPQTATIRRLGRYTIVAAALAAFWFGLTQFVRLILLGLLGVQPADPAAAALLQEQFARTAALALVGAPAWWGHWWSQQARARIPGTTGHAERASALRRGYLYAIILIGACIALASLGFGAFLALNGQVAGVAGLRAGAATAGAAALIALLWAISHALTLRGDDRWLIADSRLQIADGREQMADEVPATNRGPRSFQREALPALAEVLNPQPAVVSQRPSATVVVIDGADGAVGTALLSVLHRAMPAAVFWPMGLNAAAQVAMLNALGAGTPPAVPPDALARAIAILGPSDITMSGGLDGEVTDELAAALAGSSARLLLLPPRDPRLRWVAAPDWPLERWVENAVIEVSGLLTMDD